ncbi:hypothetical protein [Clostridium beijerinckii]|uniref:Uncharacterized protein n=1 Tax=Clostridium beijerinckii TaxID=1520 RepID=A0AAE5H6G9_CLOBE|nr:hypothetical protein [Clostridium beijerinckii]NSB14837.1 hypothetical protein [Clostridium beijerinckii]OOM19716.1 hypothetical protein CLOBE_52180 [Clostridium beijerinckii]
MTYNKKEKTIQKTGDMSQSKVKSFVEREETTNKVVSRGRDITINQKH